MKTKLSAVITIIALLSSLAQAGDRQACDNAWYANKGDAYFVLNYGTVNESNLDEFLMYSKLAIAKLNAASVACAGIPGASYQISNVQTDIANMVARIKRELRYQKQQEEEAIRKKEEEIRQKEIHAQSMRDDVALYNSLQKHSKERIEYQNNLKNIKRKQKSKTNAITTENTEQNLEDAIRSVE